MHVLYLHQHFVCRSGTSGGRSHEFARILTESGHRVTLVTGAYDHSGLEVPANKSTWRTDVDGIQVLVANVPYNQRMTPGRRIFSFLRFMLMATWLALKTRNIDVVLASSTPLTIAVPGIFASVFHRRPFVFEVRDLWPAIPIQLGILRNPLAKSLAKWLEHLAYRKASRIIALSPGIQEGIVSAGVSESKVTVIPNSSDVELFRVPPRVGREFRSGFPEIGDRPLVAYAGSFGRVNGLEYVVKLAKSVFELDPQVCFLLAGQGSEKPKILAMARALAVLNSNLFVIDLLPRSELARLLSAADLLSSFFIPLPIMETNSANKFFDAFAAGKPIVINYGGWQANIIEGSGAGLVLDPHDVDKAAARLVAALDDPEWLSRAAEASRRLGDKEFDRRKLATAFEDVLTTTAARART